MNRLLILGGAGFVGRHLCEKAGQLHCRVTVATRRLENAKKIQTLPWVDPIEADVHDEAVLAHLVRGHDAVVNLVAILHGTQAAFFDAHVALVQKLVRACEANAVKRVVHLSAIGAAPDAPSMYQRSKAEGEAVLNASRLDFTIIRPSVVYGAGDQFLNLFAKLQSLFPLMPLACAATRFQPVWVEDLAQAIVNTLREPATVPSPRGIGRVIEACGPEALSLKQLVQMAGRLSGHQRPVLALPMALGRLQARLMELAPGQPLMSRDNIDSMQVDNVANPNLPGLATLGITTHPIGAIAPGYLGMDPKDVLLARRRAAGRF